VSKKNLTKINRARNTIEHGWEQALPCSFFGEDSVGCILGQELRMWKLETPEPHHFSWHLLKKINKLIN